MEMASSSAPTTSYYNVSVAQAVLTLSINAILLWLTTVIKSSSSGGRRREAAPAAAPSATAPPSPSSPAKPAAAAVDMDVVLGLLGAVSVGFEEAAALFEEEEATVEEAREAFAVFDRNGDGFIDAAELRSVLTSLGLQSGVAEAECQRMIDAYDGDRDGRIDFLEFVKLMETSH
ncbi:calmodulin-like protein 3 [Miscanthus floridulus]|uniref:calmodulin-like protein 3 n=1 Tax=Miscanthus floridulus TaxID=154761 RepID=UPI00345A7A73